MLAGEQSCRADLPMMTASSLTSPGSGVGEFLPIYARNGGQDSLPGLAVGKYTSTKFGTVQCANERTPGSQSATLKVVHLKPASRI